MLSAIIYPYLAKFTNKQIEYNILAWGRYCFWTLDFIRAASFEITLVRLSVPPSVRLSVKFSQDWIISSFWYCTWWAMISSDSWPWYLATWYLKKIGGPNWGQFSRFCKFEVAYNVSLQQFIICSRGKTRKINLGWFGQK